MNPENLSLAASLTSPSYISLASNSLSSFQKSIRILLSQRCLFDDPWEELSIKLLLNNIAQMDTNNFPQKVGVGEREARIFSPLVKDRNFYLGHGIGRSGDVNAIQPKAVGSSLLLKICEYLTLDAIRIMGVGFAKKVIILPLATGMSMMMVFISLKQKKGGAKYVIWPRIDQKTCLKCILSAGLVPVPIEGKLENDEITTNVEEIEKKILELGTENILAIFSTTSCFAPRVPDDIIELAKLAKKYQIFHVVNNAYGLQCSKIINSINLAHNVGSVDLIVQSTDKNFMVPVGGSIVFSEKKELIKDLASLYPGRASSAPIVDLFITFLSMGRKGLKNLLSERKENYNYLKSRLEVIAQKFGERVLSTKKNGISIGVSLTNLDLILKKGGKGENVGDFGSILYGKRVMGSRVISEKEAQEIAGGFKFKNYGSNIENYHTLPYFTVAAAIGLDRKEIDCFIVRLEETFAEMHKKAKKVEIFKEPKEKEKNEETKVEEVKE